MVYKLKKDLYGLKQAPYAWHDKLTKYLQNTSFKQSVVDVFVFTRIGPKGVVVVVIYVDDFIIIGDECLLTNVKKDLASEFEMKDLGELRYFLGLEVVKCPNGLIFVSEKVYDGYIESVLDV